MPLVLDQRFKLKSYSGSSSTVEPGKNQPTSQPGQDAAYIDIEDIPSIGKLPDPGKNLEAASGGSFLSNEIMYRVGVWRNQNKSGLATGHIHVPFVSPPTNDKGERLVEGIKQVAKS